jgi:hypothetical protein
MVASAQATGQVWEHFSIGYLETERLSYQLAIEPKAQVLVDAGQPKWFSIGATSRVTYSLLPWMDVLGELEIGKRSQTDETNPTMIAPRLGIQLQILSRIIQAHRDTHGAALEARPKFRPVISTLIRMERQRTFDNTDAPEKVAWRLRDRFSFAYPLNRPKTTDDGALYLTTDSELFTPVDHYSTGRLVDEMRVRSGFGFRHSFSWRFEALYIWDTQRRSDSGSLAPAFHAIDLRARYEF